MLVHWNSHFNIANMENEVYSERSMSMHSLCRILFFRCLIRLDERRKTAGYSPVEGPFGSGGSVMWTVTVKGD